MPSALGLSAISALAGQPVPKRLLVDIARLEREYFAQRPDPADRRQSVDFGAGGHRGSPLFGTFTEAHVLAITQAICDYRRVSGAQGPLFLGRDTHALSGLAHDTALEVLAANNVETILQQHDEATPAPVISHAILAHNIRRKDHLADGIVITPSQNPPEDGGIRYNASHGGPADADITQWIQDRANHLLGAAASVKRIAYAQAISAPTTHEQDLLLPYVDDLKNVVDLEAIRGARLQLAVDPLGGAATSYWEEITSVYGLDLALVNPVIDPTFSFMTVDYDGRIRMNCSSPYAMARLIAMKDRYRLGFGNDPDAGCCGIVTPSAGLLNPNHYLAVAVRYLPAHRPQWSQHSFVGKTLMSSSMIDFVVQQARRPLAEMPAGFKWFARALLDGTCCFGGEETAGASFLRRDGSVWSTDKDGIIMSLLAAEITARTGHDPGEHYRELVAEFGPSFYRSIETPATPELRGKLERLSPLAVSESRMAGYPIVAKLTHAPANNAPFGGLKVVTSGGWFAARPSGAANRYTICAESFQSEAHLDIILTEGRDILRRALVS